MKPLNFFLTQRRSQRGLFGFFASVVTLALSPANALAQNPALAKDAEVALKKAATYFHDQVASRGGYVYYVSTDLKEHWGEGVATGDQIFTEPPGTPAVGRAYLQAYAATGDAFYLKAATDTGRALVHGQLESGGWTQRIDFNPAGTHASRYRNGKGKADGFNHSSLDDNQSQSSIQFLARLDAALEFKDAQIHDAAIYALDGLLKAQFPNGAFPQGWRAPVEPHPVMKASYPTEWPRIWPHEAYHVYYTLNDGLAGTVSDTLLTAHEVYGGTRYRDALQKLGDFLIIAQMPAPQPAWCQQYNFEMQPTWARKFEPPAICGLESEDAIKTLMKIYRLTGDKKYLEPIPPALAYLRTCVLPDGLMPRYRELKTNKPLYMKQPPGVSGNSKSPGLYEFTDDVAKAAKHYGWKQPTKLDEIAKEFGELQSGQKHAATVRQRSTADGKLVAIEPSERNAASNVKSLEAEVKRIVKELDAEGRWVTEYDGKSRLVGQPKFAKGFRFLASNTFNYNVEILSAYLAGARAK
ncbi:pectate lyase [Oleiharenicola lentus]|uniref:pectate lyase n=1 Tax=Oleiharenicola lentus TaxID=2508720 RepID=UPI003F680210